MYLGCTVNNGETGLHNLDVPVKKWLFQQASCLINTSSLSDIFCFIVFKLSNQTKANTAKRLAVCVGDIGTSWGPTLSGERGCAKNK